METVIDVAGEMLDDLKAKVSDFGENAESAPRVHEYSSDSLRHDVPRMRAGTRGRQARRAGGEFGRDEGGKRWVRWIEEKKIRPPTQF
jgi:hypothetical protein